MQGLQDDAQKASVQELRFLKKAATGSNSDLATVQTGTTNEEVLAMMIDRMEFLQTILPCRENVRVINKLREAVAVLNLRTEDRQKRGVEGKQEE